MPQLPKNIPDKSDMSGMAVGWLLVVFISKERENKITLHHQNEMTTEQKHPMVDFSASLLK